MQDKRIDLFGLLKQEGKLSKILVYPAIEEVDDPYTHTTKKTFLNPITVEALVRNISTEALTWKYYGLIPAESKEIICEKRWKETIKSASKIQIDDELYKCYHDDVKGFGILTRQDYIVVVLELKND
jgi:hypothetical protein